MRLGGGRGGGGDEDVSLANTAVTHCRSPLDSRLLCTRAKLEELIYEVFACVEPACHREAKRQAVSSTPGPSRPLSAPTVGGQLLREAFVLYVLALLEDHDLCH